MGPIELALKRYRRRLDFDPADESSADVARGIIDAMAARREAHLFAQVLGMCPAAVRQEILAFVASLSAAGCDRFILGVGSPMTEDQVQREREAQRASYREIAAAAGMEPRQAEPGSVLSGGES